MKKILMCISLFTVMTTQAQRILTTTPSGGNKKALVGEQIGLTQVTIHYDRPAVKGREGKIWGSLVPVGLHDQQFGNTKQAPWRAGANETTTIEFSTDVTIEGKALKAGKYGFYIVYDPVESTLIFSQDHSSWGSYYYDPAKDVLRVKVTPVAMPASTERLQYVFSAQTDNAATISLVWEKLAIPFRVETDLMRNQLEVYRRELRTDKGFYWVPWQQAAQWCADNNINLEEALQWADTATHAGILGDRNFTTLSTKATILRKLGRVQEATATMQDAYQLGTMQQVHQYARTLLQNKQYKEALEVFQLNHTRYPGAFTTVFGLARGYSAVGNYSKALEFAEKALPLAPEGINKAAVEKGIAALKAGKDMNE